VAAELLRVVAVDGELVPDPRHRLPGRGAWLHADPECLTKAERRKAFPRALRVPGPLDVGPLWEQLDANGVTGGEPVPAAQEFRKQVDPS